MKAHLLRSAITRFLLVAAPFCALGSLFLHGSPVLRLGAWLLCLAGVLLAARIAFVPPLRRLGAGIASSEAEVVERERELQRVEAQLSGQPDLQREARLVEETNRRLAVRLRELSLLFDITRALNSTLDLDVLLGGLTEMVATTLGFDGFAVLLVDETHGDLRVRASYGKLPDGCSSDDRQALAPGAAGEAVTTGRLVFERRAMVGDAAGSLLAVPMEHKGQVLGVLVFSRGRTDGFLPEEMELVTSIAGQAALAISNARLYERTVALSLTDPLTGVFNRRHLFAHLEMELRRAERYGDALTVVMIDIDHFKRLNDSFGHATGDAVLQAVAAVLRRNVRRVDTVARFGGEEFCLILPRQKRDEALEVAEKLRIAVHELRAPPRPPNPPVRIAASFGVATWPADGSDAFSLLDAADSALYASKRAGRNRSTAYAPGMELHPERQRQITAAAADDLLPQVQLVAN